MSTNLKATFANSQPHSCLSAIDDQLTIITQALQGLPFQPQPAVPLHHNVVRPQVSITDPYGLEVFSSWLDENFNLWIDCFNRLAQANRWTDMQKRQKVPSFLRGYVE